MRKSAPATEDPSGEELDVDEDDGYDVSDIENEDDDEQSWIYIHNDVSFEVYINFHIPMEDGFKDSMIQGIHGICLVLNLFTSITKMKTNYNLQHINKLLNLPVMNNRGHLLKLILRSLNRLCQIPIIWNLLMKDH